MRFLSSVAESALCRRSRKGSLPGQIGAGRGSLINLVPLGKRKRRMQEEDLVLQRHSRITIISSQLFQNLMKKVKFEELLSRMKADLYGSVESVAERINKSVAAVDPPKRGVPIITSNVQLVPPRPIPERARVSQEEPELFSDLETWTEVTNRRSKRKQVRIAVNDDSVEPTGVAARTGVG